MDVDENEIAEIGRNAVHWCVAKQIECGIDVHAAFDESQVQLRYWNLGQHQVKRRVLSDHGLADLFPDLVADRPDRLDVHA